MAANMSQKLPEPVLRVSYRSGQHRLMLLWQSLHTVSRSLGASRHTAVSCHQQQGFGEANVESISFPYLPNGGAL